MVKPMETINIQLSNDKFESVIVYHQTKHFIVCAVPDNDLKGYQIVIDVKPRYKRVIKLYNKREAIRLSNYLEKHSDCLQILGGNEQYISLTFKEILINYCLDKRLYNVFIGRRRLADCR